MVETHPEIKSLLITAINKGREINPDTAYNPVQSLEDYYAFISRTEKAMPWELTRYTQHARLYDRIDQSLAYMFFISDIPLPELDGKGYFNNSLQYVEPYASWIVSFTKGWGSFLDTETSWNNSYYELALSEEKFGLTNNWYEDPSNWKTFNQFFTRRLRSADQRPIADSQDESVVVSPADAIPEGTWEIDSSSFIKEKDGIAIKSARLYSVKALVGEDSKYADAFANGVFTHTFLDVGDYHRYHFPVSGVIKEARVIPAPNSTGGYITWDEKKKKYMFDASSIGWQSIETRGSIILETQDHGLVALLPIGMTPVVSIKFSDNVKPGAAVKKGDEMGSFLFGGSDFVMLFDKKLGFIIDAPKNEGSATYKHLLMGERYGKFAPAK